MNRLYQEILQGPGFQFAGTGNCQFRSSIVSFRSVYDQHAHSTLNIRTAENRYYYLGWTLRASLTLPERPSLRTAIIGSRHIQQETFDQAIRFIAFEPSVVLCGECDGPDTFGREWAESQGIPVESYPADWSKGRSAGPVRNAHMIGQSEAVFAIWDGRTTGTADAIRRAVRAKLPIHLILRGDQ